MNLVTHSILTSHLAGAFLTAHGGGRWQKAKTWESLNITLHMIWVAHLDAHHLITATDTQYGSPFATGADNSLGAAITTELIKIVER